MSPPLGEAGALPKEKSMDPEIMEKLLFHRSYKAAPMSATHLAASTRARDTTRTTNDRNHLTNAGTTIMSPNNGNNNNNNRTTNPGWYISSGDTPEENKSSQGILPNISVEESQDEILSRKEKIRSNKLPPKLGRGYHIERIAAARKGEKYPHPHRSTQTISKNTILEKNTTTTTSSPEKNTKENSKVNTIKDNSKQNKNQKEEEDNVEKLKQLESSKEGKSVATSSKATTTKLSHNKTTSHASHHTNGNVSRALVKTPDPKVRQQRREIASMRLKIDLLWDELFVPTRDRQAVLKAIIKNEEDALELLSGHLHVLLAHKRNTLAVLELIRVREEVLANLMSRCDEDFVKLQKENKLKKKQKEEELEKEKEAASLQKDGEDNDNISILSQQSKHTTTNSLDLNSQADVLSYASSHQSSIKGHNGGNPTKKKTLNEKVKPLVDDMLKVPEVIKYDPVVKNNKNKGKSDTNASQNASQDASQNASQNDGASSLGGGSGGDHIENDSENNSVKDSDMYVSDDMLRTFELDQSKEEPVIEEMDKSYDANLSVEKEEVSKEVSVGNDDVLNTTAYNTTLKDIDESNPIMKNNEDEEEDDEVILRDLLAQLILISSQVVQSILQWRTSLYRPLPFSFRIHSNYLIKMNNDVNFFLKDDRTNSILSKLLKSIDVSPCSLALLLPSDTPFFQQAPELDYIKIVTSMTEQQIKKPTNNKGKDNDDGKEEKESDVKICSDTLWSVAQILSMEKMIMEQVEVEAKIRKENKSFIPLLKPVSAFIQNSTPPSQNQNQEQKTTTSNQSKSGDQSKDQGINGHGMDLQMSSIENHPHHPLEPPAPIPFNLLTSEGNDVNFKLGTMTSNQHSGVSTLNIPIILHMLFPDIYPEPPPVNDDDKDGQSQNMIDISNFTPEQLLQLQLKQQRHHDNIPRFQAFPVGHGTSTATGSSVGGGYGGSSLDSSIVDHGESIEDYGIDYRESDSELDVGFGDVFGGGSYGRNGIENHETNHHHHHHHNHNGDHKHHKHHDDPKEEDNVHNNVHNRLDDNVDYDEILLSKVRDDRSIVIQAQKLIPREFSDSIHFAITTCLINKTFIESDINDVGILHVKELYPVIVNLTSSLVGYDHGELSSFVDLRCSLAQALLYARVYDENCMITQEDFPDYLRTLLVMCWISTLPDHGLELLKHSKSVNNGESRGGGGSEGKHFNHTNHSTSKSSASNHGSVDQQASFDSRWLEEDEIDLNKQLSSKFNVEAHWSSEYGQYYFYDVENDVTTWECPIKNFKKHSSKSLLSLTKNEQNDQNNNQMNSPNNNNNDINSGKSSPPFMSSLQEGLEGSDVITKSKNDEDKKKHQDETDSYLAKISDLEKQIEKYEIERVKSLNSNKNNDSESPLSSPPAAVAQDISTPLVTKKTEKVTGTSLNVTDNRHLTFNTAESSSVDDTVKSRFAKHNVTELPANLSVEESNYLLSTYNKMEVHGLNIAKFHAAVNHCMLDLPGTTFTKADLPRVKDMDKAFHHADMDKSGVVDFKEFISLYSKIKAGEVDGLAGYGLFEWKRKGTPKNKVKPSK